MRRVGFSWAFSVCAAVGMASLCGAQLPPGFVDLKVGSGWEQVAGMCFAPAGGPDERIFAWEKSGKVWNVENGVRNSLPLVDIREEVGDWADYGLVGFAVDPNFWSNGYVYLFYVVDYHYLRYFGTPQYNPNASLPVHDTIGRITRYTCNAGDGFRTVDLNSRTILLGESMSTGIPILHLSHGVGTLIFGEDGTLLASCGEGASFENLDIGGPRPSSSNTGLADGIISTKEDVGAYRSQLVDSLSGKILRLDPATGDGVPSNPYYDASAPRAARSRVYALGLRNPYRMCLRPGTGNPDPAAGNPGVLYHGDVGMDAKEELNVTTAAGQNHGWPIYEGFEFAPVANYGYSTANKANLDAPNPLYQVGGCSQEYFYFRQLLIQDTLAPSFPNPCDSGVQIPAGVPHWVHRRPALDWDHSPAFPARVGIYVGNNAATAEVGAPGSPVEGEQFGGNASTGGVWYTGSSFPPEYHNTYFHGDYGREWIRNFVFDTDNKPVLSRPFLPDNRARVTALQVHPGTGDLYYVQFEADQFQRAEIHRVIYVGSGNQPPVAVATADASYGATPLTVQFNGSGSSDPEGQPLSYEWDFGDGWPTSSEVNPSHTFTDEIDITSQGTIVARIFEFDPPYPTGPQGNKDPETIRDSDMPPVGTADVGRHYATFHDGWQGADDWMGYTFASPTTISGLIYQEGISTEWGGFLSTFTVELKIGGSWQVAPGLVVTPPYSHYNGVDFETFLCRFTPTVASGIRIRGNPMNNLDYFSIGELRVLSPAPEGSGPRCHTVTLTVTDDVGVSSVDELLVSPNNTPPTVTLVSPLPGTLFPTAYESTVALEATIGDAETPGELACRWQTILHHNTHNHPEPPVSSCSAEATVSQHGIDCGDFYYEFQLVVTDPQCLSSSVSVTMLPNCCKPDFNNDLFLDGIDYDAFMNAFEGGLPTADYNLDSFVDGIDYDQFVNDFEAGCP